MLKKIVLFIPIMIGLLLMPISCQSVHDENREIRYEAVQFDKENKISRADIEKISPLMTLSEVIAAIGAPCVDEGSTMHPFFYMWELDDGSTLHITFVAENYESFIKKYEGNEFVLSEEEISIDEETGLRFATENENNALKEWIHSSKAVYACIKFDGKEILFDSLQDSLSEMGSYDYS